MLDNEKEFWERLTNMIVKAMNSLIETIKTHPMPSPETASALRKLDEDMHEVKGDVEKIKNRMLTALISFAVASISYGIWVGMVQASLNNKADNTDVQVILEKISNVEQTNARIEDALDRIAPRNATR